MATRSDLVVERSRALAVVHGMVQRVREDYSHLVAESLSFISELSEESEPQISQQLNQLKALIKDVTGEDLDEYLKA